MLQLWFCHHQHEQFKGSHEEASSGASGHAAAGAVQVRHATVAGLTPRHSACLTFRGDSVWAAAGGGGHRSHSCDVMSLPGAHCAATCAATRRHSNPTCGNTPETKTTTTSKLTELLMRPSRRAAGESSSNRPFPTVPCPPRLSPDSTTKKESFSKQNIYQMWSWRSESVFFSNKCELLDNNWLKTRFSTNKLAKLSQSWVNCVISF